MGVVVAPTYGALGRVILRMTQSFDPSDAHRELVSGLVEELGAALARIWLLEPGDLCARCTMAGACPSRTQCLHLVASAGLSDRIDGAHQRVPMGALKIGQIATTRQSVCINDVQSDPRIEDQEWARREGLVSFVGHPLESRGALLGVLAMFGRNAMAPAEQERVRVFAAQASAAIELARLWHELSRAKEQLQAENAYLKDELKAGRSVRILGQSPALKREIEKLARVAPTSATVMILGETGTGKELFARELHAQSPRAGKTLVRVNCAAFSATLIESELFGHEKGAFTGATARRAGRFELAHGGTLFLDEIGELPLEAQAKLLRVLQEREFERIGGTQTIRVDIRLVCATNRDLAAEVRNHRFREDLFYRLNVFPISVPPLRERRDDIPLLVDAFVPDIAKRVGRDVRSVDPSAMRALSGYDWPGNVRELQNVLERAVILARHRHIGLEDISGVTLDALGDGSPDVQSAKETTEGTSLRQRVGAFERSLLAGAIDSAEGNQSKAARLLRTSRATLQHKIKAHRL